jgi:hypothetical protein
MIFQINYLDVMQVYEGKKVEKGAAPFRCVEQGTPLKYVLSCPLNENMDKIYVTN